MISRWVIDLAQARDNEEHYIRYWKYMYVGKCDGEVIIRFNTKRNDDLDPEEFSKITNLDGIDHLLITNTAQSGKILVIYYEEKRGGMNILWQ